jgi:hypothetical protein
MEGEIKALKARLETLERSQPSRRVGVWGGEEELFTGKPAEHPTTKTPLQYLVKLEEAQAKCNALGGTTWKDTSIKCCLCAGRSASGSFHLDGFIWPHSYLHYLQDHWVPIDPAFGEYLLKFDSTAPHQVSWS